MKYSPKQFYNDFPKDKRKQETLACALFLRPISFLVSSLFVLFGVGANTASIISLFFSLSSCGLIVGCIFSGIDLLFYLSIACFFIWGVLDCVDGNIARSIKKEKYGDFLDAIAGYIYPGFFFVLFGMLSYFTNDVIFCHPQLWVVVLSSMAGVGTITLLLANKKFSENKLAYESCEKVVGKKTTNPFVSFAKRMWSEISFGGLMPFVFLFSFIFRFTRIVVIFYSICFLLLFFVGLFYLLYQTIKANK